MFTKADTTRESFALTLDQAPLQEQIKRGRYDYVNPGVTADNFALTLPAGKREVVLFEPGGLVLSSDEMVGRVKAEGFVPATLDDALALGAQFPERQRTNPLVFLGTIRRFDGARHVPVLSVWRHWRWLALGWYSDDWYGLYRFAAVRES